MTKVRLYFIYLELSGIERDLELCRKERADIHAAEAYLQRQAMFLRADLKR